MRIDQHRGTQAVAAVRVISARLGGARRVDHPAVDGVHVGAAAGRSQDQRAGHPFRAAHQLAQAGPPLRSAADRRSRREERRHGDHVRGAVEVGVSVENPTRQSFRQGSGEGTILRCLRPTVIRVFAHRVTPLPPTPS